MLRRVLVMATAALLAGAAPAWATDSYTVDTANHVLTFSNDDGGGLVEVVEDSGGSNFLLATDAPPTGTCSAYTADDTSFSPRYSVSCPTSGITRVVLNGGAGNDTLSGVRGFSRIRFCFPNPCTATPPTIPIQLPMTLNGGGGDDTLTASVNTDSLFGGDGNDTLSGNDNDDSLDGGPGADTLRGGNGGDSLGGGDGVDTVSYSDRSSTVIADPGGGANDGSPNEHDDIHVDVENLVGGSGGDILNGSDGPNTIQGGDGNDTIDGKGGFDLLYGDNGGDSLTALDGNPERVDCGDGTGDSASRDAFDNVAGCETDQPSTALEADQDKDGFSVPADCNDADPAIHPGAKDEPDNKIDEDCSGADATISDADKDGFAVPADCDDHNAAVHPGVPEIFGNAVDEDCNGRADPLQAIESNVRSRFNATARTTAIARLQVVALRGGTAVTVSCAGGARCPLKAPRPTTPSKDVVRLDLRKLFALRSAKPGAALTIVLSRNDSITKIFTFRFRKAKIPTIVTQCQRPGAKPGACP